MASESQFDADTYLEVMQTVAGIPVRDEWKEGVAQHLSTAEKMAGIVEAAQIDPDTIDLANVFQVKSP
ncbi:DUF4089 domain-containing protein [Microbulbifer rhizosphaerae]|uniref:DUF4089 domain-containing protein n=1 Tax=Microbulbifer rhizosphaerae TaxID=1562603 RepID=A0A7W4ZBY2_9GAMM|nr:DUF4089 domain-containing protein [Microbulbifer rhizosphaerae]MBB3062894.1 hypothetical protein [Microbulbifer rhizosphaerae]